MPPLALPMPDVDIEKKCYRPTNGAGATKVRKSYCDTRSCGCPCPRVHEPPNFKVHVPRLTVIGTHVLEGFHLLMTHNSLCASQSKDD